ncbi:hypothetical protein [Halomonas sp. BM-2019]|uniref:hypothetical protein n=1 Tax=Halomonas sp. BM-2019 TaxID=2811227 RepID=UPI001B3C446D|nr:MAG: hypothetical protein J5F18_13180 [Halomonas sp. BM-2019]
MSLGSIADDNNILIAATVGSHVGGTRAVSRPSANNTKPKDACVTTSQMGMQPSGDPVKDQEQLQTFLDNIATDGIEGLIEEGHWLAYKKLDLHDGTRLSGQGMERTIIEARTEDWRQDNYVLMHLNVDRTLHHHGVFLKDFCLIGADKEATHNGPLIRLEGMSDFLLERILAVDASSYSFYITGYGVGNFTNDIHSDFWNSTHRGIIRQCRALRGFIGIGCEGGAQNVLIMGNHTDGQVLHGFRLASAYDTQLIANSAVNTRNGYWIDRHRGIHVLYNTASNVEQGCAYGGFHQTDDGEISTGLWIMGNQFKTSRSGITDAYQGTSDKFTRMVKIKDNYLLGGGIRLLWSRQIDVQSNDGDGSNAIVTSHKVSGMIGNNYMRLMNRSPDVVDIGRNMTPPSA